MRFYLITGFLGAGKTTFLKNFIRQLAPARIHLIINEFGREGVDGGLLRELGACMEEISNGSIFCTCRLDCFEDALARIAAEKPDVIVAEASGLADPTHVRAVLEKFPEIEYAGAICLADACRLPAVFAAAPVVRTQLAAASLVLLNKTDLAGPQQAAAARRCILEANPCARIEPVQYGRMPPELLSAVRPAAASPEGQAASLAADRDLTLQKACLAVSPDMPADSLRKCLVQLCESAWRIKGFVVLEGRGWYVDCTGPTVCMTPWQGETSGRLVLLAGRGMPLRRAVNEALRWYPAFLSRVRDEETGLPFPNNPK